MCYHMTPLPFHRESVEVGKCHPGLLDISQENVDLCHLFTDLEIPKAFFFLRVFSEEVSEEDSHYALKSSACPQWGF